MTEVFVVGDTPVQVFNVGDFVFSKWAGNSFVMHATFGQGGGSYSLLNPVTGKLKADAQHRVRKSSREPTEWEIAQFAYHHMVDHDY